MQLNFKTRAKARTFASLLKTNGKVCKIVDNGNTKARYGVKIIKVK